MTGSQAVSRFEANPQLTNNSLETSFMVYRWTSLPNILYRFYCKLHTITTIHRATSYHHTTTPIPASTSSLINIISHIDYFIDWLYVCNCLYIRVARYCFFCQYADILQLVFCIIGFTHADRFLHEQEKDVMERCKKTLRGASPKLNTANRERNIRLLGWERKSAQSKVKLG